MYGIFTYISRRNQLNVGKYTSPMDPSWGLKSPKGVFERYIFFVE